MKNYRFIVLILDTNEVYTTTMNIDLLLDVVLETGKMLIESGAEIYRVEETVNRICKSFDEVVQAESYVTTTGIMISIKTQKQTYTRIGRVFTRSVNLEIVHQINSLSRRITNEKMSVEELVKELYAIKNGKRYTHLMTVLFGGIGAAGFALFFDGNQREMAASFFIGLMVRAMVQYLSGKKVHPFINNMTSSACAIIFSYCVSNIVPYTNPDTLVISSIMLLVPGLAITNGIRDTMSGDYLSGISRATEAFIVSAAIAIGAGVALTVVRLW